MPASRPVPREASLTGRIASDSVSPREASLTGRIASVHILKKSADRLRSLQTAVGHLWQFFCWKHQESVGWTGGLDSTILCHEPYVYAWGVCIHWTDNYVRKVDSELVRSPLFPACLGCFYHSRPLIHYSRFCLTFVFFFLASHTLKQK